MTLEDFLVDKGQLHGKLVAVKGGAACWDTDICLLYGIETPLASVSFDPSNLSRDDRRRLLTCSPVGKRCDLVVTGVTNGSVAEELRADSVQWVEPNQENVAGR